MEYNEIIIEISKILTGIVIGTVFTTWYKDFKDKKKAKRDLFIRMIRCRGYITIPQVLIDDLNAIDIIFKKDKKVLQRWQTYLGDLSLPEHQLDWHRQQALYYDLLREIGNLVGYSNLDNKTLNSRYIPNVSFDAHYPSKEFHDELLDYLKSGNQLYKVLAENAKNNPPTDNAEIIQS